MADSIKISLELADKAAQQSLSDFVNKANNADKAFKKLGDSGGQAFGGISVGIGKALTSFDVFTANLAATAVTEALGFLKDAAHAAFDVFVIEGVKAASEAEAALNSLNVSLAQAGNYSAEASKDFQDFAASLQRTTTFEDDAIIKNAALLESMTRLDNEGLKRATVAALNLSAAFGIDLDTATRNVAKAAEGNVTSLKKLGLEFETGGSKATTFANALTAIESRLGSSASSKVNTYAGAVDQAKNNFGDLQESIGNIIVQNPVVISAIQAVSKIFNELSGFIGDNKQEFAELVGKVFIGLIDGAKYVVAAFDFIYRSVKFAFDGIKVVVYDTLAALSIPLALFSDTVKGVYKSLADDSKKAAADMANAFTGDSPLDKVGESLDKIGQAAEFGFGKLVAGSNAAAATVKNNQAPISVMTELQKKLNEETNKYVEALASQSSNSQTKYANDLEALNAFYEERKAVETEQEESSVQFKQDLETSYMANRQLLLDEQYARDVERVKGSTTEETTKNAALIQLETKFNLDKQKLKTQALQKDKEFNKTREQDLTASLSTISTLQQSNVKELFFIGKAAALANAYIQAQSAVMQALGSAPPPFNFALAALVGVASAFNIAKIASASPPAFEQGGIVPGSSYSGDRVAAQVNSGEMILNRQQQAELFKVANGSGGNGEMLSRMEALDRKFNALLSMPNIIQIDGREVFNAVRSGLDSGRSF